MVLVKNWPFYHLFVFRQCTSGKYVLQYPRTKKRLSTFKKLKK